MNGFLPEVLGELQREGKIKAGPCKVSELYLDEGPCRQREQLGCSASGHSALHVAWRRPLP